MEVLRPLDNPSRESFRDKNAASIAQDDAPRILIVAGPGSGKSFLFMQRIEYWLSLHEEAKVCVTSFVRKLVRDLQAEVGTRIDNEQRDRVAVSTLHSLARSMVEQAHGTETRPFEPHVQVISGTWVNMVWRDVLAFHPRLSARKYAHGSFERQLNTETLDTDSNWADVRETYGVLTTFYNALGFADFIQLAREVIDEKPEINQHVLWIIDEFQDFNTAEEHLIRELVDSALGVVIAGDDEQALYQQLKASLPEIIISYYEDDQYANAMLPYCSRCSYHVCLAASAFIAQERSVNSIDKVYLPLKVDASEPRVQVVATNTPSTAVDYIKKFLDDRSEELAQHIAKMEARDETDPFLLILTPEKRAKFYRTHNADKDLHMYLSQWSAIDIGHSADYRKVLSYCRVAWVPSDNFATRKVLEYQGVSAAGAHELIAYALEHDCSLAEVRDDAISEALTACEGVARIVGSDEISSAEMVGRLNDQIGVGDPQRLRDELERDPIGFLNVDEEAEEAIQTAGVLAAVEMMSIMGSKGLSAQHVIMIGCDEVNLAKTTRLAFFVGITRARKSLHLLVSAKAGGGTTTHQFVQSLPAEHCDFVVYKKTRRVTERMASKSALLARLDQWASIRQRSPRG
jgi:superfamily I DNA/RNA helicase